MDYIKTRKVIPSCYLGPPPPPPAQPGTAVIMTLEDFPQARRAGADYGEARRTTTQDHGTACLGDENGLRKRRGWKIERDKASRVVGSLR